MNNLAKKIVVVIIVMQVLTLYACGSKNDLSQEEKYNIVFTGISDLEENQPYWNSINNHSFAKGEGGYYYANVVKGDMNIIFISDSDFSSIPLCGKANCSHNDLSCNAFISGCQSNSIWRYKDKIYIIKYDSGKAILLDMNLDGTDRRELFEIGAYDPENAFNLSFGNDNVYISSRRGNFGLEDGIETTLRKRSLDGKIDENIYNNQEKNTVLEGVKCYGNYVFFTVQCIEYNEKTGKKETSGKGIYCSKFDSNSSQLFMEGNISDLCIDEENNCMYYYQIGDGLYKYSLLDNSRNKIFEAELQSYLCQISFNNDVVMLSNERWQAFCGLKDVSPQLWILDRDGNVINQMPTKSYSTQFGDSNALLFTYRGKPGYILNEQINTCTEWNEIEK